MHELHGEVELCLKCGAIWQYQGDGSRWPLHVVAEPDACLCGDCVWLEDVIRREQATREHLLRLAAEFEANFGVSPSHFSAMSEESRRELLEQHGIEQHGMKKHGMEKIAEQLAEQLS